MQKNPKKYLPDKRIAVLILVSVLLLTVSVGIVSAYYTNSDKNKNQFTTGENENKIVEEFNPPDEQIAGSNKYQKQVKVQNTGNIPCYVRLYVDFSDSEILNYSRFSDDNTNFYPANPEKSDSFADYLNNKAGSKWKYSDGYYYYTEPVEPDKSTEPLFGWIDTDYNQHGDKIRQYEVMVYSETVQTLDTNGNQYTDSENNPAWKQAWNDFLN